MNEQATTEGSTCAAVRERPPLKLKTWPQQFQAVLERRKKFEYRKNDRGFLVGDVLQLWEWEPMAWTTGEFDPDGGEYTGRGLLAIVTYMVVGPEFGVPEGYCVMSIDGICPISPAGEPTSEAAQLSPSEAKKIATSSSPIGEGEK